MPNHLNRENRTIRLRRAILCVAFGAIISATFFTGSHAMAWGMLKDLNGPLKYSFLVFPVYEKHQINYCIDLHRRSAKLGGYTKKTINIETRFALRLWLNAVKDLTGPVKLHRQKYCYDQSLNLVITVGPAVPPPAPQLFTNTFSYTYPHNWVRRYEHIVLNTQHRYLFKEQQILIIDFNNVVPSGFNLKSALEYVSSNQMSDKQIAKWSGKPLINIYNTSFAALLLETGHAFGLCDTAALSFQPLITNCDPKWSSPSSILYQPASVMRSDLFYHLTPDDVTGIRKLFKRFARVKSLRR